MNIALTFSCKKPEAELVKTTMGYFTDHGFVHTKSEGKLFEFTKGSTINNFIAFNPLNWKSTVSVSFQQKESASLEVFCKAEITTFGQIVRSSEKEAWEKFIENYRISTQGHEYVNSKPIGEAVKKSNLRLILIIFLVVAVFSFVNAFVRGIARY